MVSLPVLRPPCARDQPAPATYASTRSNGPAKVHAAGLVLHGWSHDPLGDPRSILLLTSSSISPRQRDTCHSRLQGELRGERLRTLRRREVLRVHRRVDRGLACFGTHQLETRIALLHEAARRRLGYLPG
ncbi:MAG: hypothetical protein MZV64_23010 [Ignavibacteriales bacterium]|nr:hypothetical protein [Ignavibacteriales bacterium]